MTQRDPSEARWTAADTITTALGIPGGAFAVVRTAGGSASVTPRDVVEVTAVRELDPPRVATPVPVEGEGG